MNLTSSYPFWSVANGLPANYPFALGYGGNGITFSLIAAEIIQDYFLGRTNRDAQRQRRIHCCGKNTAMGPVKSVRRTKTSSTPTCWLFLKHDS